MRNFVPIEKHFSRWETLRNFSHTEKLWETFPYLINFLLLRIFLLQINFTPVEKLFSRKAEETLLLLRKFEQIWENLSLPEKRLPLRNFSPPEMFWETFLSLRNFIYRDISLEIFLPLRNFSLPEKTSFWKVIFLLRDLNKLFSRWEFFLVLGNIFPTFRLLL